MTLENKEIDMERMVPDLTSGIQRQEGGLRTRGYVKETVFVQPLVTIVTVVLNGLSHIESTIQSVLGQDYENIEYLVIDGGSSDGTVDIIKKYDDRIDYWVSEKDRGLSDAFNKGALLASGKSILYMNSGDSFFSKSTVRTALSMADNDWKSVIYGNALAGELFVNTDHKAILDSFLLENPVCHQAVFIPADLQREYLYDLRYHYSMDLDLWHRLTLFANVDFRKVDLVVCNYMIGGLTSKMTNQENVVYEHWLVKQSYFESHEKYRGLIRLSKRLIYLRMKMLLWKIVGDDRYQFLKGLMMRMA